LFEGPAPKKKRAKKAASQAGEKESETGSFVYGGDEATLGSLDPEMKEVAAKCKKPPACLQNLVVERILKGEMLGRSISKAGWWKSIWVVSHIISSTWYQVIDCGRMMF